MKLSKNIFRMVAFVVILSQLNGCNKENDPTPADLIVGKWTVKTVNLTLHVGAQTLVTYLTGQGQSNADAQLTEMSITNDIKSNLPESIEFQKGGKYLSTGGGSISGTWEITADGKGLTIDKGEQYAITTLSTTALDFKGDIKTDDYFQDTMTIRVEFELRK